MPACGGAASAPDSFLETAVASIASVAVNQTIPPRNRIATSQLSDLPDWVAIRFVLRLCCLVCKAIRPHGAGTVSDRQSGDKRPASRAVGGGDYKLSFVIKPDRVKRCPKESAKKGVSMTTRFHQLLAASAALAGLSHELSASDQPLPMLRQTNYLAVLPAAGERDRYPQGGRYSPLTPMLGFTLTVLTAARSPAAKSGLAGVRPGDSG